MNQSKCYFWELNNPGLVWVSIDITMRNNAPSMQMRAVVSTGTTVKEDGQEFQLYESSQHNQLNQFKYSSKVK